MITSDCGQHIMERFRDGEISGYKAIEIVRDTVSLSQPASQSQKVIIILSTPHDLFILTHKKKLEKIKWKESEASVAFLRFSRWSGR